MYIIYNYINDEYIILIDKKSVEEYFNKYEQILEIDQIDDENDWIPLSSKIQMDKKVFCIEYNLSIIDNKIFLARYDESGGGGSYHELFSISINKSREESIEWLFDWFDNEHDHKDEITEMTFEECKNNFKDALLKHNIYNSEDCYNECSFEIIQIDI